MNHTLPQDAWKCMNMREILLAYTDRSTDYSRIIRRAMRLVESDELLAFLFQFLFRFHFCFYFVSRKLENKNWNWNWS